MFKLILQALWFFGPAGFANMAPIVAKKVPKSNWLAIPIDGGRKFRGKRIFGANKTVRGFVSGFIAALMIAYIQRWLYVEYNWVQDNLAFFDYTTVHPIIWAFLSSQGALVGDTVESFFKRQANIPPGTDWLPYDLLDQIVGVFIFTSVVVVLQPIEYLVTFLVIFLLIPVINFVAYLMRLKDSPF